MSEVVKQYIDPIHFKQVHSAIMKSMHEAVDVEYRYVRGIIEVDGLDGDVVVGKQSVLRGVSKGVKNEVSMYTFNEAGGVAVSQVIAALGLLQEPLNENSDGSVHGVVLFDKEPTGISVLSDFAHGTEASSDKIIQSEFERVTSAFGFNSDELFGEGARQEYMSLDYSRVERIITGISSLPNILNT